MTTPTRTGTPAQLNASGGDGSTSVTVPADCNGIVAFWSHWDGNAGSTLSGLTLNSVGFTVRSQLAEGAATDESGVGVATLMSPATGSQTVAWTWSAGGARSEGGEIVLVFYKDCNTSDPVRAFGTNAATGSTQPTVSLASTDSTDMVVGFTQSFSTGTPNLTGVTEFINDAALNNHEYDVGDDTGLSGTVVIGNSGPNYSATAAISLKASGGGPTIFEGTGDLDAQASTLSGAALHHRVGTGALSLQAATLSGSGVLRKTASGVLTAQAATMSGVGIARRASAGALIAQSPAISGDGIVQRTAASELTAGAALIAGNAIVWRVATGGLTPSAATIVGVGENSAAPPASEPETGSHGMSNLLRLRLLRI